MPIIPKLGWGGAVRASKIKNDSDAPGSSVAAALSGLYQTALNREWTATLSMVSSPSSCLVPVTVPGRVRAIFVGLGASPDAAMSVDFLTTGGSLGPTYTIAMGTAPGALPVFEPDVGTGQVEQGQVVAINFDTGGNAIAGYVMFIVQVTADT